MNAIEPVISVKNVTKRYRIGQKKKNQSLTQNFLRPLLHLTDSFQRIQGMTNVPDASLDDIVYALKNISFDVYPGESLGILGKNGAGKSTLLKLLTRVTKPDEGEIKVVGYVGSMLEVGTGFHPELTGYENIFMNGSILGLTPNEIEDRLDEIIEFSEIEQFIYTPIKFYSSGMNVRLAFAVSVLLRPDILIVDEVLSVGDIGFQQKCYAKINELIDAGTTLILVTHSPGLLNILCTRGMVFDLGEIVFEGDPQQTIEVYESLFNYA